MKRISRFLIRLYPAWWRRRYGQELEALLEDSGSRDVWDLLRGAMEMQMKTWSFARIVIVCGIAGVLLAGIVAFSMPYRYRSTATLKAETRNGSPAYWNALETAAFPPQALSDIVQQEHLYTNMPTEDSIERLRRDIRMEPVSQDLAKVSFAYEDPIQAQRVSQDLVSRLIAANLTTRGVNGTALRLSLVVAADKPKKQIERKRYGLAGLGLPAGLLFGVVVALILRRRAPAST
jgi:uncharacterized protein involved in exopolysaccharide biosynthesis